MRAEPIEKRPNERHIEQMRIPLFWKTRNSAPSTLFKNFNPITASYLRMVPSRYIRTDFTFNQVIKLDVFFFVLF